MRGGIPVALVGGKEVPLGGRLEPDGTASLSFHNADETEIESNDWQDELLSLMRRLVLGMEMLVNKGNKLPDLKR